MKKAILPLIVLTSVLASCGQQTTTPDTQASTQNQKAAYTTIQGLQNTQGMAVTPKDFTNQFKNIPLGAIPTGENSLNSQALNTPSCDFLTVRANAGYIQTQYAGGSGWHWAVRMNQPYLYYSYDYTITMNGQIYEQHKNWFDQPDGNFYAPKGVVVEITAVGYAVNGTAYGTLLCHT